MRLDPVFLLFFVLYCLEAGTFFFLAPWNGGWDRLALEVPVASLRGLLLTPTFRGAVSGFGLVHLVWGVHDARLVVGRWRMARRAVRDVPS
jgi:hypothetical protein